MQQNSITLSSLNSWIRESTQNAFPEPVWVIAEILEMNVNRTGHCYMELVEKSANDNSIVAKSRATIWSTRFNMVRSYFETTTGTKLEPGIKVLVKSAVTFHEIYGLSLNITDIDPKYTLGDIAVRKQEVINKLKASGVMDMNKELQLSEVPQHIAVISSETAAGYGDFIHSLLNNSYKFRFQVSFFPAIVQGEAAERSIISALENIYTTETPFDAVVIIRGGGSKSDLDCFNGYDMALNIAQFPIPVLTGIGHDRDETIADIVAHQSLKTPTAVAEYLIDRIALFSDKLNRLQDRFEHTVKWIIQQEKLTLQQKETDMGYLQKLFLQRENEELARLSTIMVRLTGQLIKDARISLQNYSDKFSYLWRGLFERQKQEMELLKINKRRIITDRLRRNNEQLRSFERSLELLHPERVLARGYSITRFNGKAVKSIANLNHGASIETKIADGTILSTIDEVKRKSIKQQDNDKAGDNL